MVRRQFPELEIQGSRPWLVVLFARQGVQRHSIFMCGTLRCALVVYIALFQEVHLSVNASLGEGVVHLLLLLPGIVLHTASAALGTLLIRGGRLEKVVDLTCGHDRQQPPA